jgi:ribokinase
MDEKMHSQSRLTIVGSFNTDLSVRTPRMPAGGETILGGPFKSGPGGKGANQAVAAVRLGADVTMVVKLGKDIFGDLAAQNLAREAIHCDYVLRTDATHTGVAFIIVDDTGENMIIVAAGANDQLTPADVDLARKAIETADLVLLQLEVPIETVEYATRLAHEAGVKVLLNPAPGRLLNADLLRRVDVLTPNETEASLITGMSVSSLSEADAAGKHLIAEGVGAVVVTMGANGALVVTPDGAQHVPGRQVDVVDTTGAGDAFSGSLAVALSEGKQLVEAARFANVAAALQVTKYGTAPAMPYRGEVDALLD